MTTILTPIFSVQVDFTDIDVIAETLFIPPPASVCKAMTLRCCINAVFLVDTDVLGNYNDHKADDLGSWRNHGKKTSYVPIHQAGRGTVNLKLTRTYYVHSRHPDFKRRVAEIETSDGQRKPIILLQYFLTATNTR